MTTTVTLSRDLRTSGVRHDMHSAHSRQGTLRMRRARVFELRRNAGHVQHGSHGRLSPSSGMQHMPHTWQDAL